MSYVTDPPASPARDFADPVSAIGNGRLHPGGRGAGSRPDERPGHGNALGLGRLPRRAERTVGCAYGHAPALPLAHSLTRADRRPRTDRAARTDGTARADAAADAGRYAHPHRRAALHPLSRRDDAPDLQPLLARGGRHPHHAQ